MCLKDPMTLTRSPLGAWGEGSHPGPSLRALPVRASTLGLGPGPGSPAFAFGLPGLQQIRLSLPPRISWTKAQWCDRVEGWAKHPWENCSSSGRVCPPPVSRFLPTRPHQTQDYPRAIMAGTPMLQMGKLRLGRGSSLAPGQKPSAKGPVEF